MINFKTILKIIIAILLLEAVPPAGVAVVIAWLVMRFCGIGKSNGENPKD